MEVLFSLHHIFYTLYTTVSTLKIQYEYDDESLHEKFAVL